MTTANLDLIFVNQSSIGAKGTAANQTSCTRDHVCEICNKPFKRSEHLLRHTRAHRQERPFKCRYCPKGFARKDLLTRHEKTLHALTYKERDNVLPRRVRRTSQHNGSTVLESPEKTPTGCVIIKGTSISYNNKGEVNRVLDRASTPSEGLSSRGSGTSAMSFIDNHHPQVLQSPFASGFDLQTGSQGVHGLSRTSQRPASTSECMIPPTNINALSEQLVQNSEQSNVSQHNMNATLSSLTQNLQGDAQSFGMPVEVDNTGLFSMIDESVFTQVYFPLDLMDFNTSPLSFDADGSTTGSNPDAQAGLKGDLPQDHFSVDTVTVDSAAKTNDTAVHPQQATRKTPSSKQIIVSDSVRERLLEDLSQNYRIGNEQLRRLPSTRSMDNFLRKFFQCFQRHLPIFHVPTFDMLTAPSPLILAMCSIGALYSLARKHAAALRLVAHDAMEELQPRKYASQAASLEPLWQTQCKLLITFGAMFGSSPGDASDGMSELGYFVKPYALHREMLSTQNSAQHHTRWTDWIEYESTKRLLCGIFIASSLNSATYDLSPGFSNFRDLNLEIPTNESLWNAQSSEEWQLLMDNQSAKNPGVISEVVNQLVSGDEARLPNPCCSDIGAFAATVVMHGVNVHMYYMAHSMLSLATLNAAATIGHALRVSHQKQIERALSRCSDFLKAWQLAHDDTLQNRHEESFIFNCQALLRLSYVRIFSGLVTFNHNTLLREDTTEIAKAANAYVNIYQFRNSFLTKAAEQVMFCFTAPVRAGHMLTRKTAAFTWSVEHAVACWECTLFLSKWTHTVEMQALDLPLSQEERNIFETLKETLEEADSSYDDQVSLAAQVTRTWSTFMDDVWVWEITLRMGSILRQLADVYDLSWQRRRMCDSVWQTREHHVCFL